jgi:predicted secreted protein
MSIKREFDSRTQLKVAQVPSRSIYRASRHPVIVAMRAAAEHGCDPRNSHAEMSRRFDKIIRDRVRRLEVKVSLLQRQAE